MSRWYGPKLDISWMPTACWDGGCPQHMADRRGGERILGMLRCDCVAALAIGVAWHWGTVNEDDWHGVEIIWPAKLHPRYRAPDAVGFYYRRAMKAEENLERARKVLGEVDDVLREGLEVWPKIPDRIEWTRWCIREHRRLAAGLPASENP